MRIFVVPTWHPTPDRPLFANWVRPHIEAPRRHGIETIVLQVDLAEEASAEPSSQTRSPIGLPEDGHLYRAAAIPKRPFRRTRWLYQGLLDAYTSALCGLYDEAVRRFGPPDVIHAHVSLPGGYAAARLGAERAVPVVVTEHYTGFDNDARFPWRLGAFVREMGRRIQGFYAVSPGFAERIAQTGLLEVTGVLPNPIDTDFFRPGSYESRSALTIVSAGGLSQRKGADVLLDAVGELPEQLDWSLHIYGGAADRPRYRRWLESAPWSERVVVHGFVTQSQLVGVFSSADVYVVASRLETANVAMLQAMSCGTPVVTTRCGAPETLVDDTVALSVPSDDPAAMAEALARVGSRERRFERSAVRDFVVERYSFASVARQMASAYAAAVRCLEDRGRE